MPTAFEIDVIEDSLVFFFQTILGALSRRKWPEDGDTGLGEKDSQSPINLKIYEISDREKKFRGKTEDIYSQFSLVKLENSFIESQRRKHHYQFVLVCCSSELWSMSILVFSPLLSTEVSSRKTLASNSGCLALDHAQERST